MSYPHRPYEPPGQRGPERYHLRLIRHTGSFAFWRQHSYVVYGTLEECEAAYRDAQMRNRQLIVWTLPSRVANRMARSSNDNAIRAVRAMAHHAQAAAWPAATPAGWYPDPSGPGQRYWDGAAWTHWTHPPSHR